MNYVPSNILANMNGNIGTRPEFPTTTIAPKPIAAKIKKPKYELDPSLIRMEKRPIDTFSANSLAAKFKKLQELALSKVTTGLSFEARESISSVICNCLSVGEDAQRHLEISKMEVLQLKSELKKKNDCIEQMRKSCEVYIARISGLEEHLGTLQDNLNSRQQFTVRNRRAVGRLASTNRMLIDSLDALQDEPVFQHAPGQIGYDRTVSSVTPGRPQTNESAAITPGRPQTNQSSARDFTSPARPFSPALAKTPVHNEIVEMESFKETNNSKVEVGDVKGNKLRVALLRVAREHYKSMKLSEVLDSKVAEQRLDLRKAEEKTREMALELAELRSITLHAGDDTECIDKTTSIVKRVRRIDERFKALLARSAVEPLDGITKMRKVVNHLSLVPPIPSTKEVALYFCNRDIVNVFDVEMMIIFLIIPNTRSEMVLKFTQRSAHGEINKVIENSLIGEVLTTGKVCRANNVQKSHNFKDIDSTPGLVAKKALSVPIYNKLKNIVIGGIHFINKIGNGAFSEADDLFALMYADQIASIIDYCQCYEALRTRSELCRCLLESSIGIFNAAPDPGSLAAQQVLRPQDILFQLEMSAKESIKCWKCRAFLVSDYAVGVGGSLDSGNFLILESVPGVNPKNSGALTYRTVSAHSGLAGHAYKTRRLFETLDVHQDTYYNPEVDLDPTGFPLITAPIVNLNGEVLGCLQAVGGQNGPPVILDDFSPGSSEIILLGQALEWLAHQLAAPLSYILRYVGKLATRPMSTPRSVYSPTRSDWKRSLTESRESNSIIKEDTENNSFVHLMSDEFGGQSFVDVQPYDGYTDENARSQIATLRDKLDQALNDLEQSKTSASVEIDRLISHSQSLEAEVVHWRTICEEKSEALDSLENTMKLKRAASMRRPGPNVKVEREISKRDGSMGQVEEEPEEVSAPMTSGTVGLEPLEEEQPVLTERDSNSDQLEALNVQHETELAKLSQSYEEQLSKLNADLIESQRKTQELIDKAAEANKLKKKLEDQHVQQLLEIENKSMETKELTFLQKQQLVDKDQDIASLKSTVEDANSEIDRLKSVIKGLKGSSQVSTQPSEISENFAKKIAEQTALIEQLREELAASKAISSAPAAASGVHHVSAAGSVMSPIGGPPAGPPPAAVPPSDPAPTEKGDSEKLTASRPISGANSGKPPPTPSSAEIAQLEKQSSVGESHGEWVESLDEYGQTYYYNTITGETSWSLRVGEAGLLEGSVGDGSVLEEWEEQYDQSGNVYYVNTVTGESQWELPAGATVRAAAPIDNGVVSGGSVYSVGDRSHASVGGYTIEL